MSPEGTIVPEELIPWVLKIKLYFWLDSADFDFAIRIISVEKHGLCPVFLIFLFGLLLNLTVGRTS